MTFESIQIFFTVLMTTTIVISHKNNLTRISNYPDMRLEKNITCLCSSDEMCDLNSPTCKITKQTDRCYESWTYVSHEVPILVTAGCITIDRFFVQVMCSENNTNRYIACCSHGDYCNDLDAYSQEIRRTLLSNRLKYRFPHVSRVTLVLIIVISIIVAVLLLIGSLIIYLRHKNIKERQNDYTKNIHYFDDSHEKHVIQRLSKVLNCAHRPYGKHEGSIPENQPLTSLLDEFSTSTVGPALPLLMQRTLARQITLEGTIGTGRYGTVHRGKWREDNVAVKIFSANDERSWLREIDIYQTVCLRHENILGYIAADNKDASTHTQLWLVTEYQENGSVYDYLMKHTITVPILIKMMLSIASGLCHLHMPIYSTNGKVALAHRDLKTKNILVKKDLTCCIADLGLAVKEVRTRPKSRKDPSATNSLNEEQVNIDIQANSRVGTIRYMAPEVLDGTLNERSFESFKAADMYALGLVYWEILRRCQISSTESDVDPYQVAYEDVVPSNPSFEQMREAVCTKKIRPESSARWITHPVLQYIVRLCEELWIEDPACRLSSLNVKKQLKSQMESVENSLSNANVDSQQQSASNDGPWTA